MNRSLFVRSFAMMAAAAPLGPLALPALAQRSNRSYPNKPIRLIIPFAPGGPTDISARMVANELSKSLGQPIVADNRPGAGGNIGAEAAAYAAPDGYTLFWAQAATHGINPTLYPRLGYDALRDFTPVAVIVSEPLVIVANPSFAANDVPSLIAAAKARPGEVRFGSGGQGSTPHMAGQLFGWLSESSLLHVPYKGNAPAVASLMAGHIDIVFDGVNAAIGDIRSGKLKALGVTGRSRSALLPDVAPLADTLPDYEVTSWGGIVAPAATPRDVVERLSNALVAIGSWPDTQQRFAQLGIQLLVSSPQQMDAFVREQIARWRPLVEASGSRVE